MRIVLADDQSLLRESLAEALRARGHEIAGQAGSGEALLPLALDPTVDIVVADIRMPPTHTLEGLEAAAEIRRRRPAMPVLLLSHHVETAIAVDLVRDDPRGLGYLLKDRVSHMDAFEQTLERLVDGETVIDPEVIARLLGRPRAHGPLDELTSRERQVLAAMAQGRSNRAIAHELGIEEKTVEYHVSQILGKLGIEANAADHRRVLAVLAWLREAR